MVLDVNPGCLQDPGKNVNDFALTDLLEADVKIRELGTIVPKRRRTVRGKFLSRYSQTQKAHSPNRSDEQAFIDAPKHTERNFVWSNGYGVVCFLSQGSNVSTDTSFSAAERPTTPTAEPISSESMCLDVEKNQL